MVEEFVLDVIDQIRQTDWRQSWRSETLSLITDITRSIISSEWKLFRFEKMVKVNDFEILLIYVTCYLLKNVIECDIK